MRLDAQTEKDVDNVALEASLWEAVYGGGAVQPASLTANGVSSNKPGGKTPQVSFYFASIPCGLARNPGNAVLKSSWKRGSKINWSPSILRTCTL